MFKELPPTSSDLLNYHRPRRIHLNSAPIPQPTSESKQCLRNLGSYTPAPSKFTFPRARRAAVLVALFVGRMGDLYVLLSRRASTMRSYAGDTALPGGKYEPGDRSLEETARREAFEEIGLPPDPRKAPLLCVLEPFLARTNLVVTPVVVLILDNTLRPVLNAAEVHSLFAHPLRAFLSPDAPRAPDFVDRMPELPVDDDAAAAEHAAYHSARDERWAGDPSGKRRVRVHVFTTGREAEGTKPVFGLTAAILIRAAQVALHQPPLFALHAPGQPGPAERFAHVFRTDAAFRAACLEEGIDPDAVLKEVQSEICAERKEGQKDNARL